MNQLLLILTINTNLCTADTISSHINIIHQHLKDSTKHEKNPLKMYTFTTFDFEMHSNNSVKKGNCKIFEDRDKTCWSAENNYLSSFVIDRL